MGLKNTVRITGQATLKGAKCLLYLEVKWLKNQNHIGLIQVLVMNNHYTVYNFETLKKENKGATSVFLVDFSGLKCCLVFNHRYMKSIPDLTTSHISFYALSDGWESFTETGYRSHFFMHEKEKVFNNDDLKDDFLEYIKTNGFNVEESKQISLF